MVNVTIYDANGQAQETPEFDNIDFVSLVNGNSFGPPALIAPKEGNPPVASPGDRVLYINTALVPMFEVERVD